MEMFSLRIWNETRAEYIFGEIRKGQEAIVTKHEKKEQKKH